MSTSWPCGCQIDSCQAAGSIPPHPGRNSLPHLLWFQYQLNEAQSIETLRHASPLGREIFLFFFLFLSSSPDPIGKVRRHLTDRPRLTALGFTGTLACARGLVTWKSRRAAPLSRDGLMVSPPRTNGSAICRPGCWVEPRGCSLSCRH